MYEDILNALRNGCSADQFITDIELAVQQAEEQIAAEEAEKAKKAELANARETVSIAVVDYLLEIGIVPDDEEVVIGLVNHLQDYLKMKEPSFEIIKNFLEQTETKNLEALEKVFDPTSLIKLSGII